MPTQNVNLPEHQHNLIRELTESGRYQNASEVVRAGLRLLEHQEEADRLKLERLRAEIQKGFDAIEAGEYTTVRNREELHQYMQDIRNECLEEVSQRTNV
jgi:antitoxin ParD1/3/4